MADKNDDAEVFRRAMASPQPVEYLTQEELERHRRLIKIEPELSRLGAIEPKLSKMVAREDAWALVTDALKKIAVWLTALAGGFYVFREIVRSMAG